MARDTSVYARYQLINELSRAVFAYQRELEVAIVAALWNGCKSQGKVGKRCRIEAEGNSLVRSTLVCLMRVRYLPANTHSSVIRSI